MNLFDLLFPDIPGSHVYILYNRCVRCAKDGDEVYYGSISRLVCGQCYVELINREE